mgnify:CR=1 FL=1
MRGSSKVLVLFVLTLLGLAGALAAQSTVSGSLQGRVRDAEGGALPGSTRSGARGFSPFPVCRLSRVSSTAVAA